MATSSSRAAQAPKDELVLDAVARLGFATREMLRHALCGTDPNNILQRLLNLGKLQSVRGALPQNRAYYLPAGEKALAGQALHQRMAVAWFVLMSEGGVQRVKLTQEELRDLFGEQAPQGPHVLELAEGKHRMLRAYVPLGTKVLAGLRRHVEQALALPRVAAATKAGDYGFVVLLPWSYTQLPELERELRSGRRFEVPGLHVVCECVATPDTLTLALKR